MVFNFMSDGIPIVYYGQEQGFHGNADPVSLFLTRSLGMH
jgi:alpha-amylase